MFALGKKRDAKSKKDLVELWSAQGILKQSDYYTVTGKMLLSLDSYTFKI
jgi:hypothetical protein